MIMSLTGRLKNDRNEHIIMKLKDWPPTIDFQAKMPDRFNDLMQALPLPCYTHRDGWLNLTSYLPDSFVKPDLGPKMYIAYGSVVKPSIGTTPVHEDMSGAVNMMLYVGIPDDDECEQEKGRPNNRL